MRGARCRPAASNGGRPDAACGTAAASTRPAARAASSSGSPCRRHSNWVRPSASTRPLKISRRTARRASCSAATGPQRTPSRRRRRSTISRCASAPASHTVLWAAIASGVLSAPDTLRHGELAIFEPSNEAVDFEARTDAEFVLGSAAPHQHDLVLGYYSVHTSPEALRDGEAHISTIRTRLVQEGRL